MYQSVDGASMASCGGDKVFYVLLYSLLHLILRVLETRSRMPDVLCLQEVSLPTYTLHIITRHARVTCRVERKKKVTDINNCLLSVCVSAVCLSVCLSVCLPVCLSICLSVCL